MDGVFSLSKSSLEKKVSAKNGWFLSFGGKHDNNLKLLMRVHESEEPPNISQKESLYKEPPDSAVVKLLWVDGQPVGFFFVRRKGYQEDCMNYPLAMPVLDAAFVLKAHRRCGWGLAMLDDICHEFCVGDLGLSHPLSDSMWHVLKVFLTRHPEHRDRLWSIQGCGDEGDRLNVWLSMGRRCTRTSAKNN